MSNLKRKRNIFILIGIVITVCKIFALWDVYKKRAQFSRKKVFFLTLLFLFFPPSSIFYLVYSRLPKEEGDEDYESVNLNIGA